MIAKNMPRSFSAQVKKANAPQAGLSMCRLLMVAVIIGVPAVIIFELGMVMSWLGP